MFKSLDIREDMEVVGSDDKHVGTVDHMEGSDRIKLAKNDPSADGKHHFIDLDSVSFVDEKVNLNKAAKDVMSSWQSAA